MYQEGTLDAMTSIRQDHFYIYLSSKDSFDLYPLNDAGDFKVQLPEWILLSGHWDIALTEIEYPNTFKGTKPLWLYFEIDACTTFIVGGQKLSVLRRLPLGTLNETNQSTFSSLYHVPLRQQEFDTVHVVIRDPSGKKASFDGGFVSCTLLLKRSHHASDTD